MSSSIRKIAVGVATFLLLWFGAPYVLGPVAFLLGDYSIVMMQAAGVLALSIPLVAAMLLARAPFRWSVANAAAFFAVSAAAYVWLTLGEIAEYSRVVVFEAFIPGVFFVAVIAYVGALLKPSSPHDAA